VVGVLNILEKKWGSLFSKVFKSITVDNGSEFTLVNEMEKSILFEGKRTNMYYCHPYSSWERGTNENINKMIRRKIPKGTNFDNKTDEEIQSIEDWINNYPRSIFGYHTAQEQFEKEIQKMIDSSA
jgi:IS30 family transposase